MTQNTYQILRNVVELLIITYFRLFMPADCCSGKTIDAIIRFISTDLNRADMIKTISDFFQTIGFTRTSCMRKKVSSRRDLTLCRAISGLRRLLLFAVILGAISSAQAGEFCSEAPFFGVVDGNEAYEIPTQITIDTDCTFINFPESDPLTATLNFQTNDPSIYLIVFDQVYFTGNMACSNVDHKIWFSNGADYGSNNSCQDLFIPVETIAKETPLLTTASIGVPFTYTLTLPSMELSGDPSLNDLHSIILTDDLAATGADLSYVSNTAYLDNGTTRTPLGPLTLSAASTATYIEIRHNENAVLTLVPSGSQVVIEMTVVLNDVPANTAGLQFTNTARWWFGRAIDVDGDGVITNPDEFFDPLPGEWGISQPMIIGEPDLVVTKTSSETALNLAVPATFTIDVENVGGGDAWNVTVLDQLPDGPNGGMCDFDPTTGSFSVQVVEADGVTPVAALVQGIHYSVSYSGCELNVTLLDNPNARIRPSQHLIITYTSELDGDTDDGEVLTNVAGATQWFSGSSINADRRSFIPPLGLTDGTPGVPDYQDNLTITAALAGYYFQKTVSNLDSGQNPATVAAAGDTLRYRLRLFNVDQVIDQITITDRLDPTRFDLANFSLVSLPAGATHNFNSVTGLLTINGSPGPLSVALGQELVIEFDIPLITGLVNNTPVDNEATLNAIGLIDVLSDNPYVNGISAPGDPTDITRVLIQNPGPLSKTNTQASASIGELFQYQVTVPATPIAVPLYDVKITDNISLAGAELLFVSASVDSGGSWGLVNTGSPTSLIIEDTATGIDIPANAQAVINITVALENTLTNNSGLTFLNTASYTYNRVNGDSTTEINGGSDGTASMTVVEPVLTATKVGSNATVGKAAGDPITGGDLIQYVITINNSGNSTAYDVNITDTLPTALGFFSGFVPTAAINTAAVAGFEPTPGGEPAGPLVWGRNNGDNTLDIPAGGTLVLTYQTQVLESTAATFNNEVFIDWTSVDGSSTLERTGGGCPVPVSPNDYCYGPITATSSVTDNNSPVKALINDTYVDPTSTDSDKTMRIGDIATYRLTLNLGEGTTRNVQLQDALPEGMAYDSLVSITPGSGSSTFTYTVTSQPAAGDTGTLIWDLGTIVNNPSNDGTPLDTLAIEYTAKVLQGAGITHTASTNLTNTVTLSYQDAVGNAVVDPIRLVASDTLTLWQPELSVSKTATPSGGDTVIEASEVITYTIDIINNGAAPAYDTILADTLPVGLRQSGVTTTSILLVNAGTPLAVLAPAYDANTGIATWNFDTGTANAYSIPAGETLRIAYQVTADADIGAGMTLTNSATATHYYSFDNDDIPATGLVTDRQEYGPGNTATSNLTSLPPGVLLKENTQLTAAVGEQFAYRITVPATPVNAALYDVSILDDLTASAADLRFVSVTRVSAGTWTPVNTGSDTNLAIEDTVNGIDIPAGEQVVVEVIVEVLETSTNAVGLNFTNTADYTYNQIDNTPAGQTNGLPGTTDPMLIVGLVAQKTVAISNDNNSNGLLDPGDEMIYTIEVSYPGANPVTGVVLTDDLPADTTYVSNSVTLNGLPAGQPDGGIPPLSAGIAISSPGSTSGTITPGSNAVITFRAELNAGVPAGTVISNQGYIRSDMLPTEPTDLDGNAANGHQPTTMVVSSDQQVMITKEVFVVGGGEALAGGELEYVVNVTNIGVTPTTGLVITDDLTSLAGLAAYVPGSAALNGTTTGLNYTAPVLTADYASTYGNLLAGETATLRFRVLIGSNLLPGTRLTNTAEMTWNTPALTATDSVTVDIGGEIGSAGLNGQVWHDANLDQVYSSDETVMAGWIVDVYQNNTMIQSVTTDSNGLYTLTELEPTFTIAGQYSIRFSAPGAGPNTASLGHGDSPFTDGLQRISNIIATSGANLQNLNLPLSPNGSVYDSVLRTSVAGSTLRLLNASTGTEIPGQCFDDPVQQNQVTLANGFYKFDLNFSDPSCSAGETYLIEVMPPSTGYLDMQSQIISPPEDNTAATPFPVSNCPGNAVYDAIPSTNAYCEAMLDTTVPPPSIAPSNILYYLYLSFSDGTIPGQSQIFNNFIPVDPELDGAVSITKTSAMLNVKKGSLVPYTINVTNVYGVPLYDISIIDRFPAGFKYVKGSARLDGNPFEPTINGRELSWDGLNLQFNQKYTLQLLLIVGSGVSEGKYVNRALVRTTGAGTTISAEATASVQVIPDPDFDCTDVIGKVFDDSNLNGKQNPGEKGLPGVRVVTARGLISTTDEHGRFHITCAAVPDEVRGSNFILKLDERSLPTGYRLVTENPRVQRATRGKMMRFNFGATIHRVVNIDIADGVFKPATAELRVQWTFKFAQLIEELKKGPSVLRLSYLGDVESKGLVDDRLEMLREEIIDRWEQSDGGYRLDIETKVFWRRGAPHAGQ